MTQLLFFDTFSHDLPEELNLDLVQFPRTVVVEEVRVIPLGGRVDVGGMGCRLGATNPNRFKIDFFVNNLMDPSASVFASLGSMPYDHNGQIFLDTRGKKIPTDGLLLRGHYSAITLAIYGHFSSANTAQYAPPAPDHQIPTKMKSQPSPSVVTQSTEKRWPPVPETSVVQNRPKEKNPTPKHSNWMLENGSRDNSHDYHHSGNHHNYHHHHHSSSQHHYRRSQERARSPAHREYRSRTKSPLVSHSNRRSLTPKSPPNNGHLSPNYHHRRRSASSEKNVSKEEAAPVLDDVSDISDGDILDEDNEPETLMEVVEEPTKEQHQPNFENSEEKNKEAFIPDQKVSDADDDEGEGEFVMDMENGKQPLMDIPEDIEEISDDEADWSDDGDCFFAEIDYDSIDFGTDWIDPIKVFDFENVDLPTQLKYLRVETCNKEKRTSDKDTSNEALVRLKELNEHEFVGSDWVELVESLTELDLPKSVELEPIVRRSISISDAMRQPVHTFKVRHLKSGLKFATVALKVESVWTENDFKNIIVQLIELINDQSVTIPLKIATLTAMHSILDHPRGRKVLMEDKDTAWTSQMVSIMSNQKLTTRIKIGIASLLERASLNEAISSLQNFKKDIDFVAAIKQFIQFTKSDGSPKLTFLSNVKCGVVSYVFRDFLALDFIEKLSAAYEIHPKQEVVDMELIQFFEQLVKSRQGLTLLASKPISTEKLLIKIEQSLKETNDSIQFVLYCLHIVCKLDQLFHKCHSEEVSRTELETIEILESMQDLYGMTFHPIGRSAVVHVLSISDFLKPIIRLVKHNCDEKQYQATEDEQPKRDMKKSAIRGYACELLLLVVRTSNQIEYLYFFADELLQIGKSDETSKLHELTSWLNILEEDKSIKTWDDDGNVSLSSMEFFCEMVKKHIDSISPMSCELAMAIRHLYKLLCTQDNPFGRSDALIRAFSLNLCDHGVTILNKACGYHEQPHLHTATFAGYNGHLLLTTIKPIVKIMKKLLDFLIETQDDGFRDVSTILALLKTFSLCTVVSDQYGCHIISLEICTDIIEILQGYTSISVDMSQDKTTAWQLMLQEVVKYIITSPHTYIAGLKIFSELLPLPFTWTIFEQTQLLNKLDPNSADLIQNDITNIGQDNQRNMWSAQLYGMESSLKEVIMTLLSCRTKHVRSMLGTVCHQLADLSAAIALIVADAIISSLKKNPEETAPHVADLVTFGSIKAAFLSLLREKYKDLLGNLSKDVVSTLAPPLMNPDISLTQNNSEEINANALPDLENSLSLLDAFITSDKHDMNVVSRILTQLTSTTSGLSLVRTIVLRHKSEVNKLLKSMSLDEISSMETTLLELYKVTSLEDWRELFAWTNENSSELWLQNDSFENTDIAKKLLSTLEDEQHKCEEHDLQWPEPETLLEQFCNRDMTIKKKTVTQDQANVENMNESSTEGGVDLLELIQTYLSTDFDLEQQVKHVCDEKSLEKSSKRKKQPKSLLEAKALVNKHLIINFKAGGNVIKGSRSVFNRGQRPDLFRSRPKNTSRPPSLHVDDYMALEARGQQPTGPTGYNKQSVKAAQELFAEKEAKSKGSIVGFREATKEPVYDKPSVTTHPPPGNKGRGNDRNSSGKNYRGNSRPFNNRDRHSPAAAVREYGGRENRSTGGRPQNDRRFNNSRRNKDGGSGKYHKGKGRGDGSRSSIAR